MRLAYADPPYPGQSRRHYGDHGDYAGEVDHGELISRLGGYDGWALSTSMTAMRDVLALCPPGVVVAVWNVSNAAPPGARSFWHHYTWEPVIVAPARPRKDVRNVLTTHMLGGFMKGRITGEKPHAFCTWMFALLGAETGDDLDDIFPGSGAVGEAWQSWETQVRLRPSEAEQLSLA